MFQKTCKASIDNVQGNESIGSNWTLGTVGLTQIRGFISKERCQNLIDAAEQCNWTMDPEPIDSKPVVDINVFHHGKVYSPEIYTMLEPYLPILKKKLDDRFPGFPNQLDWIFFRKYQAGTVRQSLQGHLDTNKHTINLILNSSFEGGDLYFIPTESEFGKLANAPEGSNVDKTPLFQGVIPENVPQPKEGNQSNYFFPDIEPGSVILYDHTIWHGVTPVTQGTRYSLSFFYDEPQEIAKKINHASGKAMATFENGRTVKTGVALYWVRVPEETTLFDPTRKRDYFINPDSDVEVGENGAWVESIGQNTYIGHVFAAVETGTNRILVVWRITQEREGFMLTDHHQGDLSDIR